MMRKDVAAHETICPRIVVACPICQELVKDLDAHQADPETKDRHLQLLLRKVADLENSRTTDDIVKNLERDLATNCQTVAQLMRAVGETASLVLSLVHKVDDIQQKLDRDLASHDQTVNQLRRDVVQTNSLLNSMSSKIDGVERAFSQQTASRPACVWKVTKFDEFCARGEGHRRQSPWFTVAGWGCLSVDLSFEGQTLSCFLHIQDTRDHDIVAFEGTVEFFGNEGGWDNPCASPFLSLSRSIPRDASNARFFRKIIEKREVAHLQTIWIVVNATKTATVKWWDAPAPPGAIYSPSASV